MKQYLKLSGIVLLVWACGEPPLSNLAFTPAEKRRLAARTWSQLEAPSDETNRYAHDPRAQALGRGIFFDPGFSANNLISCATCHDPTQGFSDGISLSQGLGTTRRHAPHLYNVGMQRWFYWDGRADTLWGQALSPFENESEMGSDRLTILRLIANHPQYGPEYEDLFGLMPVIVTQTDQPPAKPMPETPEDPRHLAWLTLNEEDKHQINTAFSNVGKAIAAYEMTINTEPSPFDQFVKDLRNDIETPTATFSNSARRGLKLFMSKANCHLCHTGPLFSDREFHNLGFDPIDIGRSEGVTIAQNSTFSSAGRYSDAPEGDKSVYLNALVTGHITDGAFKTPSLRNIERSAPYMHDGRFPTLESVVRFYNQMPPKAGPGDRELFLVPLGLNPSEEADLVNFLRSLTSAPSAEP